MRFLQRLLNPVRPEPGDIWEDEDGGQVEVVDVKRSGSMSYRLYPPCGGVNQPRSWCSVGDFRRWFSPL